MCIVFFGGFLNRTSDQDFGPQWNLLGNKFTIKQHEVTWASANMPVCPAVSGSRTALLMKVHLKAERVRKGKESVRATCRQFV